MRTRVSVLLVTVVLAAGCSSSVTGTARAADPSVTSPASTTSAPTSTAAALPRPAYLDGQPAAPGSRPADLALDEVDTCGLITSPLQEQVGVTASAEVGDRRCVFPIGEQGGLLVRVVDEPASTYLDNPHVAGFAVGVDDYPAVLGWNLPDDGSSCFVNLDVSDTQNLEISVGGDPGTGTDTLCPQTLAAAASVLDVLRAG